MAHKNRRPTFTDWDVVTPYFDELDTELTKRYSRHRSAAQVGLYCQNEAHEFCIRPTTPRCCDCPCHWEES